MPRDLSRSEAELVEGALRGSEEAYRQLVHRFQRPILSVISRMVKDPSVAEDLAQETFVKAFRKLDTYDPTRRLASWLFKIAHNTTLDYLRRRQLPTVPLEPSDTEGETWEVLETPEETSPERRASRRQLAAALEACLAELPPKYREVMLLRFQQGLAYQEIAEVTGQALGTVKIQLHRARKLLAKQMERRGWSLPAGG